MERFRTMCRAAFRRWAQLSGSIISLFVLLVLLNILDYQTTVNLIALTDYDVEANPLLRYTMVQTDSVTSILWVKGIILTFAAIAFKWSLIRAKKQKKLLMAKRLLKCGLIVLCFLYTLVCMHNTAGIYLLLNYPLP